MGVAVCLALAPGAAQAQVEDVFGDLGTAQAEESLAEGEGFVVGQVVDGTTGMPLSGATVILIFPAPADGGAPRQEVAVTDASGFYEFPPVPAGGGYEVQFVKAGYRTSKMTAFEVAEGGESSADFPLEPLPSEASGEVMELDAFVVEASTVNDIMAALELRLESDQLINILSDEDFAKFAASDVADALKRVSGVNVVEGRFAVIRGLEDRYSSTTFNGAPVPSSDPLRQSVQLDLFPSDVVSGLVIAKTFEAATPGNSGAGSIDIGTTEYPEQFTFKFSAGGGWNENAVDEFAGYQRNSPVADFQDPEDVIETDFSSSIGGSWEVFDRVLRAKFVAAHEIDYETALGSVHGREPNLPGCQFNLCDFFPVVKSGGLALGKLDVSNGKFDYTLSEREEQLTFFGGIGLDVDPAGDHRLDFTAFYTDKQIESVERLDEGLIPGFDYANTPAFDFNSPSDLYAIRTADAVATVGSMLSDFREDPEQLLNGPLVIDPLVRGQSVVQDRTLYVFQLNGDHELASLLEGLSFDWAANYARTLQDETGYRMRYWYEPYDAVNYNQFDLPIPPFPPRERALADLGPGSWRTNNQDIIYNENEVDETQWFVRGDGSYEMDAFEWLALEGRAGFWYELADRTLEFTDYQGSAPQPGFPGVLNGFVEGPGEMRLGPNVHRAYGLGSLGRSESDFEREITAGNLQLKGTFWDDFDLIGGLRLEQIYIKSENRPFTGQCDPPAGQPTAIDPSRSGRGCPDGYLPDIFPGRYLYLDRFDNPGNPFFIEDPSFALFGNQDQILGINLPTDANGFVDQLSPGDLFDALTGEIDEFKVLPSVTLAYRVIEGLTLRGAYSETTARPSFRELAYYASIVPGDDTRLVGNPFLDLSDVVSYDARAEYVWGDFGDLFALSFFYKTIDKPIEVIELRDFSVFDFPLFEGPFRVYRNNENEADLLGGEVEGRLTLGSLNGPFLDEPVGWLGFLDYISLGGNFTYIDASVERSSFERSFGDEFYQASQADIDAGRIKRRRLPKDRRLFNQPEWIVNGDLSFDQPDWGTKFTLSVFAISDVLRSAGSPTINRAGATGLTLDEYTASFYQLDAVFSQDFEVPWVPGIFTFKTSVKNLTDSERGIVYDREVVTGTYRERDFRIGRDWSLALQYEIVFDESIW